MKQVITFLVLSLVLAGVGESMNKYIVESGRWYDCLKRRLPLNLNNS
jgi:hypothetical protein